MTLSKGITCYGSKKGHYNFYYPDVDCPYELNVSLEVIKLNWVGAAGFEAVKIVSPVDYLPVQVLWIKTK